MITDTSAEKNNISYTNFFNNKKGLCVATTDVNRHLFKTLMKNIQIPKDNIFLARSFKDARSYIDSEKPDIIVTEYELGELNGMDLLEIHKKHFPNRLHAVFCLVSGTLSPNLICQMAEEEVDIYVPKPFTLTVLEKKFLHGCKNKIHPTDYLKELEKGKIHYNNCEYPEALEIFLNAKKLDPEPTTALLYEGLIYKNQDDDDNNAIKCFLEGIKYAPNHYRCLNELLNIFLEQRQYPQAHKVCRVISKYFPFKPDKIPQLIEMSLELKQYDDIIKYYETIRIAENLDPSIEVKLIEALIKSAEDLIYLKNDNKTAMDFLRKATELAEGNEVILGDIVKVLILANELEEADLILSEIAVDSDSHKLQTLQLQVFDLSKKSPEFVLKSALGLLAKGNKDLLVYKIALKYSRKLDRRKDLIDDLVFQASKKYPNKSGLFKRIAGKK